MSRVVTTVNCRVGSRVDVNALANSLADVIRGVTGASCRVVVNVRDAPMSTNRVAVSERRKRTSSRNIEMLGVLETGR